MLHRLSAFVVFFICLTASDASAADKTYRWNGHDFAFCFLTDDGTRSNLAWADTARVMGFRYTIAVNVKSGTLSSTRMTKQEIRSLYLDGFEIAQHGRTHGEAGLTTACASPPRGSWKGYFLCAEPDMQTRMTYLKADIERDTIATVCDIPVTSIRTAAYPRHLHGKALIDSLRTEGFIAARTGGLWDYVNNSNGDFTTFAHNSWDGGISMYRIPLANSETHFFGNHSATPPVHKTYEQFVAAAQPVIDSFKASGGIMVMYSHHLGDDNDSLGNINYGSGGVTKRDLAWLIDLVRANNGVVMNFGDAVAFYRSRSHMEDIDGDLVWMPGASAVSTDVPSTATNLTVYPNPFNPRTSIAFDLAAAERVRVAIYDLRGVLVTVLDEGHREAGHHILEWNGVDGNARPVPAGTYLLRVGTGSATQTRRMALLK